MYYKPSSWYTPCERSKSLLVLRDGQPCTVLCRLYPHLTRRVHHLYYFYNHYHYDCWLSLLVIVQSPRPFCTRMGLCGALCSRISTSIIHTTYIRALHRTVPSVPAANGAVTLSFIVSPRPFCTRDCYISICVCGKCIIHHFPGTNPVKV